VQCPGIVDVAAVEDHGLTKLVLNSLQAGAAELLPFGLKKWFDITISLATTSYQQFGPS